MAKIITLGVALFLGFFTVSVWADSASDLKRLITTENDSATTAESASDPQARPDDGTIRLTPDKTKIVHLDQDAASIVVTNPAHASVLMDSPRLLVVMPREPGTTSFTVLDKNGRTLMEKNVIVTTTAEKKYVRIRKMCKGNDSSCAAATYYYCPDGCYEVNPVAAEQNPQNIPEIVGGSSSGAEDAAGAISNDNSQTINPVQKQEPR